MSRKEKDKNSTVSGVTGTTGAKSIEHLSAVSHVEKTEKTSAISAIKGIDSSVKTHSIGEITSANKEKIFQMLHEEADKLFKTTKITEKKRNVIEKAVQMAIDSAVVDEKESKAK